MQEVYSLNASSKKYINQNAIFLHLCALSASKIYFCDNNFSYPIAQNSSQNKLLSSLP